MKSKNYGNNAAAFCVAILFTVAHAFACGPDFPNNLLDAGDQAVLQSPIADFKGELTRMKLASSPARAVPLADGQTYAEQSANADLADLAAALKRSSVSSEPATAILAFHLTQRAKFTSYLTGLHEWNSARPWIYDALGAHREAPTNAPPTFPDCQIAPGLPTEFALYFKGYLAWQNNENWRASEYWQNILALPAPERHYKSTWAAFMLGKYHAAMTNHYEDAAALKSFEHVRELEKNGFADSLGLVAASIGLEAQIYLRQNDYEPALNLYLEQYAAGDRSAVESLATTVRQLIAEKGASRGQLLSLAKNFRTQHVITAYLISRNPYTSRSEAVTDPLAKQFFDGTTAWLDAVEKAGVHDVAAAEQLALAAYQADDMDAAQRWIKLAPNQPVAQWLQAKLFMRAGNVNAAAKLLAKLSRKFPANGPDTNAAASFADDLFVTVNDTWENHISAGQQVRGELGALRLARREYTESLDALLRSGYWMDAAYVAERVLTTDELKTYIDRHWPPVSAAQSAKEKNVVPDGDYPTQADLRSNIRYLLARRLARESRYAEARNYYAAEWQTQLDTFTTGLRDGADEKLADPQRGRALFASACIARTNGMELFGTELEPDWTIYNGDFEFSALWQTRATNILTDKINLASTNELARAAARHAQPDERFHYRNQAADLAWAAAKCMPDNSEETARMLCRGGSWRRGTNDFYKTLVRRCRLTAIGAAADDLHWFPILDENGNVATVRLQMLKLTPEVTNAVSRNGAGEIFSTEFPVPGRKYVIHRGDTIVAIAAAAGRMNPTVDAPKILAVNPELEPVKMHIGQLILIPAGEPNGQPVSD